MLITQYLTALLLLGVIVATLPAPAKAEETTVWPVPDWQTGAPETQGLSTAGVEKMRDWLKASGAKTGLVVRHGRIVGEWYFDEAQPSSQYLVYSTSKSMSSTAVGMAISQGKLSLDTTVGQLLPDASPAEKRDITVRQLISMTAGVYNETKLTDLADRFTYAVTKAPMVSPPGTKWDYNNTALSILSPMMLKATGKEIDVYLHEQVFQPIGISQSDWSWEHNEGHTVPYSGCHITARALARFGLLFAHQGRWQDRQIVPAAWVAEATRPSQDLNKDYGYLWWVNKNDHWKGVPADAFAAMGKFNNCMLVVPSLDLIVIRQIGEDKGPDRKLDIGDLWRLSVEAVTDAKK